MDFTYNEIGRYLRGESNQFDGSVIGQWKTEAAAAVLAGAPYPHFHPELKRWMFEYLLALA